jgi:hypothetical protein
MIIAQQESAISFGTVAASGTTMLTATAVGSFHANLPVMVAIDSADTALEAGLVLGGCRYNSATRNLELQVGNCKTTSVTSSASHNIIFTQVQ